MNVSAALLDLVAAASAGFLLPYGATRMFVPSLEKSAHTVVNYRGRPLVPGLGIVWVFWCAGVLIAWTGLSTIQPFIGSAPRIAWLCAASLPLQFSAVMFGLIDDAYGSSDAKGFKGHIGSLLRGRLTTGGLKLFGIGGASALAAVLIVVPGPSGAPLREGLAYSGGLVAPVILATACIALSSNLVNLLDVRPGRALKAYVVLIVLAIAPLAVTYVGIMPLAPAALQILALGLWALGPVGAVWRLDVGERGMLGDAGANAFGAFAGYLLAISLPLWLLAVAVVALLVLNLASERVSFSAVIESNPVLRTLDAAGRAPVRTMNESLHRGQEAGKVQDGSPHVGKPE